MDKEEMFQAIMNNIMASYTEGNTLEGTISKSYLQSLTGLELDDELQVLIDNDDLTEDFEHLVKMYGFESFYDLYLFAKSNDEYEQVSKAGQKEFGKLKKVKRTVIRNGRPTTMTFYEDPNKQGDKSKQPKDSAEPEEEMEPPEIRQASEIPSTIVGDFQNKVPIKDLKLMRGLHDSMGGSAEFDADCDQYNLLTDEQGQIKGIMGLVVKGGYVYLKLVDSDIYTKDIRTRAFFYTIRTALQLGKGVKIPYEKTDKLFNTLAENYGLEQKGKYNQADYDSLFSFFGEVD